MKKIFTIIIAAMIGVVAYSQGSYMDSLRHMQKCFYGTLPVPNPHNESVTLKNGKKVSFIAQSDYERTSFVSADQFLRDIREWKESPYLWQMKRMKNNLAISDAKDLSQWEIDNFDKISQSYFDGNVSAFHIAAHGLLESPGKAANTIKVGGQELNPAETAELIANTMQHNFHLLVGALEPNFVVVIHSCHSADGEDNFASRLSKELAEYFPNVSVVGAPQLVYCTIQDGKYTEYISTESELKKENPTNYKWKVYKNGQNTGQGTYDYQSTVKAIQK